MDETEQERLARLLLDGIAQSRLKAEMGAFPPPFGFPTRQSRKQVDDVMRQQMRDAEDVSDFVPRRGLGMLSDGGGDPFQRQVAINSQGDPFLRRVLQNSYQQYNDVEEAQAARDAAAQRMRQAARPEGGRQEGAVSAALSDPALLFNMSPLGMARDTMQAVNEGDYGQAAVSAAPLVGMAAGPAIRGAGALMQAYPKTTAIGSGLAAMFSPAEAGPQLTDRQQQRLEMQKRGAANQLEADRQRQQMELEARQQQFEMERQRRDDAAAYAEQQRQSELQAQQAEAERQAQMPFRERYPNLAAALPAAGIAASAALPYSVRLGKVLASNRGVQQIDDAVARGATALSSLDKPQMARSVAELKSHMKNLPASSEGSISAGPVTLGVSAGLPIEAALVPAEYDAMTLPPGENRDAARALLTNPEELAKRAVPGFLQGTTFGMLGNKALMALPERLPQTANVEGLIAGLKKAENTRAPRKRSQSK